MNPLPLPVGVPGGMELAVIFLLAVFVLGPIVLVYLIASRLLGRRSPDAERVRELEAEVDRLRHRVEELDEDGP
ncbi:preprotein translocase subunit TatA [Halobacteriaceae archaeon GCM10025711]